jgi:uncharacterized protein (DUF2147 family)
VCWTWRPVFKIKTYCLADALPGLAAAEHATEGIEPRRQALCGYVLDPSSNARGETMLVDMKSKSMSEWSGNIYSRDRGNSYYGTISMKGPNALKVEACALDWFFCSGNVWSRADIKPVSLMSDRGNWPGLRS